MAIDLSQLKSDIRGLLNTANSTGASYDLSSGLSKRIVSVNSYNPEKLKPEGNLFPSVFVWTAAKRVNLETIYLTLAAGKRKAEVLFNVAGIVWVPYTTTLTGDPADNDCERLMENIEEILRANDTLGGLAKWHLTSDVTYHSAPYGEEMHMRVGLLSLRVTVHY